MAITLYLPSSSSAPDISPSPSAGWAVSTAMDRLRMSPTKSNTTMTTKTDNTSAASGAEMLNRMYIYGPLAAVSIPANVVWTLYVRGFNTGSPSYTPVTALWVATSAGALRGTIFSVNNGVGGAYGGSLSSRQHHPASYSSSAISVQDQDYLILEIGARKGGAGTGRDAQSFGDNSASNLTAGNVTTADNPVLVFATDLEIYNPAVHETATLSQGTLTFTGQTLSGISSSAEADLSAATLTLTGQAMTAIRTSYLAALDQGTLTFTGQDLSGVAADSYVNLPNGALMTFESQDVQAGWEAPDTAQLSRGTLTMTGQSITGNAEVAATINPGSLTFQGQDVIFRANVLANILTGEMILTGQEVAADASLVANLTQGLMTMTGRDVGVSAAAAAALAQGTMTMIGSLIVTRQGFTYYQVHIV